MIIPADPPDHSGVAGNLQAIWPGLEPLDGAAVLQTVVANLGTNEDSWRYFGLEYCCE